jgi:hypothetical protein
MRILVKNLEKELRKYTVGLTGLFVLCNSIRLLTEVGKAMNYFGFLLYNFWGKLNKRISFKIKMTYLFFMIAMDNNTMIAL